MASFFKSPSQLTNWIKDQETIGEAFNELMKVIKINSDVDFTDIELDVKDAVTAIYNNDDEDASKVLFKVLSEYNLTESSLKKGVYMEKEAQSKQRNDWMRGDRNKWNRSVDAHKEGTPWRVDRDQFYDFTHYTTDALSFDANPDAVYSGEALWRMYVMDKFYREYKDEDGRWVGGYINDRFHVFPDAGTPANPDVDRLHGNQMELANGERTRKPRPHQYSTERMMEEARGNKTYDLEVTTTAGSFNKLVKTASKVPVKRNEDVVYNILNDYRDMKEAGVSYENMLDLVSDHYEVSVTDVSQIAKFADKMISKHDKIAYAFSVKKTVKTARQTFKARSNFPAQTIDPQSGTQVPINILQGTVLVQTQPNTYQVSSGQGVGQEVALLLEGNNALEDLLESMDFDGEFQADADEIGLNEVGEQLTGEEEAAIEEVDNTNTFGITDL